MGCRDAIAPSGGIYRPRKPRASPVYQCVARHAEELRAAGRFQRPVEEQTIERFVECGDPHYGFARIRCEACRHGYLLAFSRKTRYFCPSCHQKRVLAYGEWVEANVLAADGAFDADGAFTVLPPIPRTVLEPWLRKDVLALLRREGLVSEALAEKMLAWRHTGFSAHNAVRVGSRTVIYRSRLHKTLKRNFQIMSGADWLVQLCRHIPDRFEHLVRYAGWHSNRSRGKRRRIEAQPAEVAICEVDVCEAARVIALIDDAAVIRKILRHLGWKALRCAS